MKQIKILSVACLCTFLFISCDKRDKTEDLQGQNVVLQSSSNSNEPVKPGETNCIDPITGNIKIKSTAQPAGTAMADVKLLSKTVKVYPSGGYILVYELTRTSSGIVVEYKKVHTSCGNPAAAALLPATSTPILNGLNAGIHNIEIRINGQVNKGSLTVHPALDSATLQMQSTNGIIIE